ncbi:MAG: FemAB family XrtA/PEP-CTERM system-associated protein [Deferrisomatales bacterium]
MAECLAADITYLVASGEAAWDAYVRAHPNGTPFHLSAWRDAVEQTFGHDAHYLVARRAGQVCGVLPLFHVRSLLFGSMAVASPFAVYGGALADDEHTARGLEDAALALGRRLGVDYVEFRDREAAQGRIGAPRDLYVTFRRELPGSADAVLGFTPRKARRMVRLSIDAGLRGRLTRAAHDVDAFYRLFAGNLRRLGTPAFPKALLENLLACFGKEADLLLIENGGEPVAGVLNFYFRDEVLPYYSGAVEELSRVGLNNFLYYDLMVKSVERGCRLFDFGRSKVETGPYHFKRHFGFEPQPLPYRQVLVKAQTLPNLNPSNPKYSRAIELWKKLPLGVTTALGPWIVRGIP